MHLFCCCSCLACCCRCHRRCHCCRRAANTGNRCCCLPLGCSAVYHELVLTTKEYMRVVSEIKPEWLVREQAPGLLCLARGCWPRHVACVGGNLGEVSACLASVEGEQGPRGHAVLLTRLCVLVLNPAAAATAAACAPPLPRWAAGGDCSPLLQQEGDHGAGVGGGAAQLM